MMGVLSLFVGSQDHWLAIPTRIKVRLLQTLSLKTCAEDCKNYFDAEFKLPVFAPVVEVGVHREMLQAVVLDNFHHSEMV